MILRIMERHEDWAVIIALVGGGQEINDGEAGLSEWVERWLVARKPGLFTLRQRSYQVDLRL